MARRRSTTRRRFRSREERSVRRVRTESLSPQPWSVQAQKKLQVWGRGSSMSGGRDGSSKKSPRRTRRSSSKSSRESERDQLRTLQKKMEKLKNMRNKKQSFDFMQKGLRA